MSKELATQNTSRYVQALYNINAGSSSLDGRDILKLDKDTGYWIYGQENNEVDEQEDVFVINPESFREGFIAFTEKGNDVAETENGDIADFLWQLGSAPSLEDHEYDHPLPAPKSSRAKAISYQFQLAIDLVCIEGPNKGAQLVYKSTSQGGREMLGKLAGEIARRKDSGAEDYVPAITLYAEDYMHRAYGRIWKPKAEILDWYTMEDDVLKETPEKAAKRDDKRAAPKAARTDRKGAAKSGVEDDAPRGRGRRDERDREIDDRDEAPEEPAADEGRRERRGGTRRDRDEAETVDARPRGRGRPEREERGRGRGRPTQGEEPRGRGRRDEEPEEEERSERRAAGGRGRR